MLRTTSKTAARPGGRHTLRSAAVAAGCLLVSGYFGYHAVWGSHGLLARGRLIERSSLLDRELASRLGLVDNLRRDVALLGQEPPQSDMVEEIAGGMLGYVRPGERIVEAPRQAMAHL